MPSSKARQKANRSLSTNRSRKQSFLWPGTRPATISKATSNPDWGRTIDPSTAQSDPNIEFIAGDTYQYYKIDNPEKGTWTASVYGQSASASSSAISQVAAQVVGTAYNLTVQAETPLTLDLAFDRPTYRAGDAINLQVSLADHRSITNAWVRAEVQRPDGTTGTMTLYDDGQHADGLADDGVYSSFYAQILTPAPIDSTYSPPDSLRWETG